MKFKKYIKFAVFFFFVAFFLSTDVGVGEAALGGSTPVGATLPTASQTGLSDQSVEDILVNVLEWLLGIVGIIAIIGFLVSGIMYLMAAGNEKMADKGKNGMTYSVIGIAIILGAFVIIQAISRALSGNASNF